LHDALVDLDLRTGIGARQYLAVGQLVHDDDPGTAAFEVREVDSSFLEGFELSVLGKARITRYLQAATECDVLMPFEGLAATIVSWRSSVSLRLGRFAALTYTLDLLRQPNVLASDPVATEQGLQLRFAYSPF